MDIISVLSFILLFLGGIALGLIMYYGHIMSIIYQWLDYNHSLFSDEPEFQPEYQQLMISLNNLDTWIKSNYSSAYPLSIFLILFGFLSNNISNNGYVINTSIIIGFALIIKIFVDNRKRKILAEGLYRSSKALIEAIDIYKKSLPIDTENTDND